MIASSSPHINNSKYIGICPILRSSRWNSQIYFCFLKGGFKYHLCHYKCARRRNKVVKRNKSSIRKARACWGRIKLLFVWVFVRYSFTLFLFFFFTGWEARDKLLSYNNKIKRKTLPLLKNKLIFLLLLNRHHAGLVNIFIRKEDYTHTYKRVIIIRERESEREELRINGSVPSGQRKNEPRWDGQKKRPCEF